MAKSKNSAVKKSVTKKTTRKSKVKRTARRKISGNTGSTGLKVRRKN